MGAEEGARPFFSSNKERRTLEYIRMIEITALQTKESGDDLSEIMNFRFPYQITDLSSADRGLFDFLSFRFLSLETGSFNGDNFSISNNDDLSRVYMLGLTVKEYASIKIVFAVDKGVSHRDFKRLLVNVLNPLSQIPVNNEAEGEEKLSKALLSLMDMNVMYLLVDGDIMDNEKHAKSLYRAILRTSYPCFFLRKNVKKKPSSKSESVVKGSKPKVGKKALKEAEITYGSGTLAYLRQNYADLLFLLIFSFFVGTGIYGGVAFIQADDAIYGLLSVFVGVICFFIAVDIDLNFVGPMDKCARNPSDYMIFNAFSSLTTVVGFGLSLLLCCLLSSTGFLFAYPYLSPLSVAILLAIALFLSLLPFVAFPLRNWANRLKTWLTRKFR